jgi:hypothetical protein
VAFDEWVVQVEVPEVTRLACTIDTWQAEVLAFFDTRASNGPSESATVKIKNVRRAARGFRNADNYRARIMLPAGQPRTPSTSATSHPSASVGGLTTCGERSSDGACPASHVGRGADHQCAQTLHRRGNNMRADPSATRHVALNSATSPCPTGYGAR